MEIVIKSNCIFHVKEEKEFMDLGIVKKKILRYIT